MFKPRRIDPFPPAKSACHSSVADARKGESATTKTRTRLSEVDGAGRHDAEAIRGMSDLETFRAEARSWLRANAPKSMFEPPRSEDDLCWGGKKTKYPADVLRWLAVMAERGWTAPTWPKAYGGGGLSKAEAKVLQEVIAELRLR